MVFMASWLATRCLAFRSLQPAASGVLYQTVGRCTSTQSASVGLVEKSPSSGESALQSHDAFTGCSPSVSSAGIPQAWITTLTGIEEESLGIIDLHPDIFQTTPRLDILHQNIRWQDNYRNVTFIKALSRAEMPGGGRKPWPNTGIGKSRQGSIRSPIWKNGGIAHGVRGPLTWFYMLPFATRLHGLRIALTIKHAQDDLVIIDDFESLFNSSSKVLHEIAEQRNWGYSVLFVDDGSVDELDFGPKKLMLATSEIPSFNVMPFYGLNCYSMLKHDTLVLSLKALERIQERVLYHMHHPASHLKKYRMKDYMSVDTIRDEEEEEEFAPFI